MYYFYVLQNKKKSTFYFGSTKDLKKRIQQHNSGQVHSTKNALPWILIYYEAYSSLKLARIRESKLKNHGKGYSELKKRILESN